MNAAEKAAAAEDTRRRRTVKGFAFMGLPADENAAIYAFLDGGPVEDLPERWQRSYAIVTEIWG